MNPVLNFWVMVFHIFYKMNLITLGLRSANDNAIRQDCGNIFFITIANLLTQKQKSIVNNHDP